MSEETVVDLINHYITINNLFLITKEQHEKYINQEEKINKAIEYIKCGITGDLENDRAYVDENALLDILQGSDKE